MENSMMEIIQKKPFRYNFTFQVILLDQLKRHWTYWKKVYWNIPQTN